MDVLSDAITAMRTGRPHSGLQRRHSPWRVDFPASDGAGFHIVLRGTCSFTPVEGGLIMLGPGDAVFLPREPGHRLSSTPHLEIGVGTDATPVGHAPETVLLCGSYQLGGSRPHPLWTSLPPFMHFPATIGSAPPLRSAIDLLGAELADAKPGADAMIPALLDALLVSMVRHWIETEADPHAPGWAAALRDRSLAAALTAMHEAPARPWTVAELARVAGMARSRFSERFTQTLAQSPIAYLTWWRMTLAAKQLRATDAPIAAVARQVGYTSEFAFAKAFKREFATAPGTYRKSDRPIEPGQPPSNHRTRSRQEALWQGLLAAAASASRARARKAIRLSILMALLPVHSSSTGSRILPPSAAHQRLPIELEAHEDCAAPERGECRLRAQEVPGHADCRRGGA